MTISVYIVIICLCCVSRPNETRRPRTLSKLNDTSLWERRKTKGKVAIQKMVVDLMELYLHRLKQRRPPYPKTPAMAEFEAQFPYKPTPDQKKVSFLFIRFLKKCENNEHDLFKILCSSCICTTLHIFLAISDYDIILLWSLLPQRLENS